MDLTNKWMNDPTFLAQSAHFFGAVAVIMSFCHFLGKPGGLIAAGILVAAAAVKEFWYDLKFELPKQTLKDSALDFTFYMVGIVVAGAMVLLK
jgi:hypothetical protein